MLERGPLNPEMPEKFKEDLRRLEQQLIVGSIINMYNPTEPQMGNNSSIPLPMLHQREDQ
jgi:hypothetical protein